MLYDRNLNTRKLKALRLIATAYDTTIRIYPARAFQVVLPACLYDQALSEVHNSPMSGHLGLHKTLATLQRQFYWPRVETPARRFVYS